MSGPEIDPVAGGTSGIERLRIERIEIDRFGGWSERSLELPDDPLIVIHGSNEAGKSTLAELITWLLVGPSGSAANAQRFGRPDERIGGTMSLRLGDTPVTATGTFRVPRSGTPNESDLVIDLAGALTAEQWRERLGGIDPQVFAAIYRLWGEQLHHGDGVENELSRVALGALAGRTNVPSLIAQLNTELADRSSRRSQNAESVHTIAALIEENRSLAAAASGNAVEHHELEQRRSGLEAERAGLARRISALRAEADVVGTAIELNDDLIELRAGEAELATLGTVPAPWVAVAADPASIADAARELTESAGRLEAATAQVGAAIGRAGLDEPAVAGLSIGDAEMVEITAATTALRAARADLGAIESDLLAARSAEREAAELLDRAVARREGLTVEHLGTVQLETAERSSLSAAIATWTTQAMNAAQSRVDAARATDLVAATESELAAARSMWSAFATGREAEAWFAQPQSNPLDPMRRWWWVSPALVAAIAVVAAAVGQWAIAVISGLVAVLVVVLAVASRRDQPRSEVQQTEMAEVATRIVSLGHQLTGQQTAAVTAADAHRNALDALEESRHGTLQTAAAFGVPIDAETPDVASAQLETTEHIIAAHRDVLDRRRRVTELEQRHRVGAQALEAVQQRLGIALAAAGLPETIPIEMIDDALPTYREAQSAWGAFVGARTAHEAASERYAASIAPLPDEVARWNADHLVERVEEMYRLQSTRQQLEDSIARLSGQLTARRGADEQLSELLDSGLTEAELRVRAIEINEMIDGLAADVERISEEIGEVSNQLDSLGRVDRLAALAIERGSLEERSDELAIEALVAAVAKHILQSVADDYEREHQPALISATEAMVRSVAPGWDAVVVRSGDDDRPEVVVAQRGLMPIQASQLSTGARSLLYLALRIAMAEHDGERRSISVPLICDDPLVHLDDERADDAFGLLQRAAASGRQVVVFTCHERTVRTGLSAGAAIVAL